MHHTAGCYRVPGMYIPRYLVLCTSISPEYRVRLVLLPSSWSRRPIDIHTRTYHTTLYIKTINQILKCRGACGGVVPRLSEILRAPKARFKFVCRRSLAVCIEVALSFCS